MNTKKRLNCYVLSNLIICFLSLNVVTNNNVKKLVLKTSTNSLNTIYEKSIVEETVNNDNYVNNVVTTSANTVISISNKSMQSHNQTTYVKPSYNSVTGSNVVNYAKNFLGLKYVSAGRSLATGTDCSGFTSLIFAEFGINLGKTVKSQLYSGTYVSKSDLKPGDIVFYSYGSVASHVAIYIGNGLIIHESNPRDGVKISSVNIMNYITARRLITANIASKEVKTEKVKEEAKVKIVDDSKVTDNIKNNDSLAKGVEKDKNIENKNELVKENSEKEIIQEKSNEEKKEKEIIKEVTIEEKKTENKNNKENVEVKKVEEKKNEEINTDATKVDSNTIEKEAKENKKTENVQEKKEDTKIVKDSKTDKKDEKTNDTKVTTETEKKEIKDNN